MIRDVKYRVHVLRNGAYLTELNWNADNPPKITMKASGAIKCSMEGTFLINDQINWYRDELQPVVIIDGVESSLGIFRPTTVTTAEEDFTKTVTVSAYDRCWLASTTKTESLLHLSAGDGYVETIKKLLQVCGIVNVIAAPSAATLPADREDWQTGTSYLTIVNDLLAEIGFNDLWFDADGLAHLEKYSAPSATAIKRRYGARDLLLPMGRDWSDETDVFDAPNVFVCICDNADRSATLTATAENTSFGAKSILSRGMRIAQVTKVKQIADQESLQAYADKLCNESLLGTREITFYTPVNPGHGVGDIISIDHDDIGGIYQETGWNVELETGASMKITAKRSVIL